MARNKTSRFAIMDDISFMEKVEEQENAKMTEPAEKKEAPAAAQLPKKKKNQKNVKKPLEYGESQGKKGLKLSRLNVGLSDLNYEYATKEARRRGMKISEFLNVMIEDYRKGPNGKLEDYGF